MRLVGPLSCLVLIAYFPACGGLDSPGTRMSLRELTNKKLDLGVSVDCRNEPSAGCTGHLTLILGYRSSDCGIIHADVTVQGLAVPQSSPGGWQGCPPYAPDDCQKTCKTPIWEGDISPVLDQIAESAIVDISDADTSFQFVVDEPTTIATIQPRGLAPGDTLGDYSDALIADLAPVSRMTLEEFHKDASGRAARHIVLHLLQNGRFFYPPVSTMTLEPKDGPWAFETVLFFSGQTTPKPIPGELAVIFSLVTYQLGFPACPDDTTCAGGADRAMLEFPIVYEP